MCLVTRVGWKLEPLLLSSTHNDDRHVGFRTMASRNVLCLGVSYASLTETKETGGRSSRRKSVAKVVDFVQRKLLSEMDGRDLARCVATEQAIPGTKVYTVSQEAGATYDATRHLSANFNRPNFVRRLREHFGEGICFHEVLLDYFWIPPGWSTSHWKHSFFSRTLVDLVDVLTHSGVVYLPFCLHVFREVLVCQDQLLQSYDVEFLRKGELNSVAIWAGTQTIDAATMQGVLAKRRDQEEIYCTIRYRDLVEDMADEYISTQEILDVACRLEDFDEVRFIVLRRRSSRGHGCGKILGLVPRETVQRGILPCRVEAATTENARAAAVVTPEKAKTSAEPRSKAKRKLFGTSERQKKARRSSSSDDTQYSEEKSFSRKGRSRERRESDVMLGSRAGETSTPRRLFGKPSTVPNKTLSQVLSVELVDRSDSSPRTVVDVEEVKQTSGRRSRRIQAYAQAVMLQSHLDSS